MDLASPQVALPLARTRQDWPGAVSPRAERTAEVARQFETLIAATLLRSARAASLGDDGLGAAGDTVRDLVDRHRAEAIARAAPMGVARLLAREAGLGAPVAPVVEGDALWLGGRQMGPRLRGGDGIGMGPVAGPGPHD